MSEKQSNLTKNEGESRFSFKRLALTLGGSLLLLCSSTNASAAEESGVVGTLKSMDDSMQQQAVEMPQEISSEERALLESKEVKEWAVNCENGNYQYCSVLAQVFLENKMYTRAASYLEKVCYSNSAEADTACAGLTSLLSDKSYNVVNIKKAQEVAGYLCDTKSVSFGCVALSQLYLVEPEIIDATKSVEYANKACDLNDATGCKQVALTLYGQAIGQKDINQAQQAFEFYKKACELGDEDSCKTYAPHAEKLKQFQQFVKRSQ